MPMQTNELMVHGFSGENMFSVKISNESVPCIKASNIYRVIYMYICGCGAQAKDCVVVPLCFTWTYCALQPRVYSIMLWCVLSITEIDRNATGCVACSLRSLISLWWWSPPRFDCCCCCCLEIRNHNLDQPTSSVCVCMCFPRSRPKVSKQYMYEHMNCMLWYSHIYMLWIVQSFVLVEQEMVLELKEEEWVTAIQSDSIHARTHSYIGRLAGQPVRPSSSFLRV